MAIRPARPEPDFPRIVALINAVEAEPVTLAQFQQWHAHMPPGRICRRMVAPNERDEAIGYSAVVHETWLPARHFYVWVTVDPQARGQGIGSALYADALAFLHAQDAASLTSEVRDDCPACLRFAERRGFAVERHQFESTLDLTAFDETPYRDVIPALEAAGIRFFSLADLHDSPEARLKLYALNHATSLDVPGANAVDMPFAEFEQWVLGAEWYRPDGQLIAADGETWVGLAAVQLLPHSQGAYNLMTGVLRPYRGRKIALALKLKAIRYARAHGARTLRTHNDSLNAPMLAINRKLGYRPQPGKYILRCNAA
jgi:GNAT superfamily N-acetyltransferase